MNLSSDQTKKKWNEAVNHPLQTWQWGLFRQKMGINVVCADNFLLTFHKIPFLPFTVGYFPKGHELNSLVVRELISLGKKHRAIYIQIEPNIIRTQTTKIPSELKPSHKPLFTKYTFVLNLSPNEADLLNSFHSKTRYNIKVAQKHGVKIQEDNSPQAFAAYLKLIEETTKRQGFYAHSLKYVETMWQTLSPSGFAKLFTATHQGKTLAAWIIFCHKDTLYYPYGASSREMREVMAPTLMLWEIAKWGKHHGYKYFDLWGALGPNPDKQDEWYGFHRFKEGFKPNLVEFVGSYDVIINPLFYQVFCWADKLRWLILKALR